MKKRLLAGAAVAALTAGWGPSPAAADGLTLDVEALYLHRDTVDDIDIVALNTTAPDSVALSTSDLGMGWVPGGRLTVGFEPDERRRYEVSGFWLDEHSDSAFANSPSLLKGDGLDVFFGDKVGDLSTDNFRDFRNAKVTYESDLWNVEGNFVYDFPPASGFTPSVLMGVRYLELDERFELLTNESPFGQTDTGYIQTSTDNRLAGLQLGGLGSWALSNAVSLDFLAKFGVYANIADQETFYFDGLDNGAGTLEIARGARGEVNVATVGELGVSLSADLTDSLAFSLGYTLMHFGGVALAPQQFPQANTLPSLGRLDNDSRALYHGATARATWRLGGNVARRQAAAERHVVPAANARSGPSRLTLDLEALYMNREVVDGVDLVYLQDPGPNIAVLSTDDLAMGYEPGGRLTLGLEPNDNRRLEVSGFWIDEHSDAESVAISAGLLQAAFNSQSAGELARGNFDNFRSGKIAYESDLWNVEGNYVYRFETGESFSPALVAGARYVNLDERFSLLAGRNPATQANIGYVQTDTENRLVGGQLGATADWALGSRISLNTVAKFGAFANLASQETHFFSGINPNASPAQIARGADGDHGIATVGELGASLTINLAESLSFSVGYTLMHVSGVALAPKNLPQMNTFSSLDRLDMNGRALYHGGNAKLTWRV